MVVVVVMTVGVGLVVMMVVAVDLVANTCHSSRGAPCFPETKSSLEELCLCLAQELILSKLESAKSNEQNPWPGYTNIFIYIY